MKHVALPLALSAQMDDQLTTHRTDCIHSAKVEKLQPATDNESCKCSGTNGRKKASLVMQIASTPTPALGCCDCLRLHYTLERKGEALVMSIADDTLAVFQEALWCNRLTGSNLITPSKQ